MNRTMSTLPKNAHDTPEEEDFLPDGEEPPDLERTPRPSALGLRDSFKTPFSRSTLRLERKESLLTSALCLNNTSPIEEHGYDKDPSRAMSCTSTWSNNSTSTTELTSDAGFTSSGTRTSTPSPSLLASSFHDMASTFNKTSFRGPVSIVHDDDESISPLQSATPSAGEYGLEATLGRKRCISFACGPKKEKNVEPEQPKPRGPAQKTPTPPKRACTIKFASEQPKPPPPAQETSAPPKRACTIKFASEQPKPPPPAQETSAPQKRACTIKFACPTKISTDAPTKENQPRRAASPAPARRPRANSKTPKVHRGSDSTVRNPSPIAVRKPFAVNRSRRLSGNSDLARCEAFRFHEFASSEEEVQEWTEESTCHRRPLTIKDTLSIENGLRKLGEEAEEEALDDEDGEDILDDVDDDEAELDEDDEDENSDDDDAYKDLSSDEGFQTDDEEGFANSDDESDAGSDYNWWAPGHSTAATSVEHLDHIRPIARRSISESSINSDDSSNGQPYKPEKIVKRRKSRPVNIRVPSPELPDSTDFVCGTLDEDRPLEDAYMSALELRRAAKHKMTPQDVDPTFPTSDPEMDEEDEDDAPDYIASESDQHFMMHGQMEPLTGDLRGRRRSGATKRSPAPSPKRLRSPPPAKRAVRRSPPPRKLFGTSPRPLRSPPAPIRPRSSPPVRRGSSNTNVQKLPGLSIQFTGLEHRSTLTMSASLPRTPIKAQSTDYVDDDDEDTPHEFPIRRAIDIKVGLEKRRQRRKDQLYKKKHCKNAKEKRPVPGKGCERMREVGLGIAAYRGKTNGLGFQGPQTPDKNPIHVLSV
jgi:hypothetical protein